ncbi:hypothetical protein [Furfurilactobacillus siliginis]|uniref:Uncharacterized protein n=1 Tax=Furfurilactobacillus siliginis TaxID=348151 RepID=A0A510VNF0_9LACO|nr:hypothetical protein [Furfurilactobacillus siliginis]GEK28464.1 hypothetical protein LSI01_07750 [Furfurilactobacillus siliginis]
MENNKTEDQKLISQIWAKYDYSVVKLMTTDNHADLEAWGAASSRETDRRLKLVSDAAARIKTKQDEMAK